MDNASATPSSRRFDMPPTATPALSRSSANYGGGQGGDDTPPSSPRFNLPDSYWSQPREPQTRNLPERSSADFHARHLAAHSEGQAYIARLVERMHEDGENDPRTRIAGPVIQLDTTLMGPVNYQLPTETLARITVLLNDPDPEGTATESAATTSFATSLQATATEQATTSGGCIPPSCTIL